MRPKLTLKSVLKDSPNNARALFGLADVTSKMATTLDDADRVEVGALRRNRILSPGRQQRFTRNREMAEATQLCRCGQDSRFHRGNQSFPGRKTFTRRRRRLRTGDRTGKGRRRSLRRGREGSQRAREEIQSINDRLRIFAVNHRDRRVTTSIRPLSETFDLGVLRKLWWHNPVL